MNNPDMEKDSPANAQDDTADYTGLINGWVDFIQKLDGSMSEQYAQAGMETKRAILYMALRIEHQTSEMLGHLLGIEHEKSKVLGYLGRPIEFSQKIQFLIEVGGLEKDDRALFTSFMEIRNMMLHNYSASSMEKCLAMLNEKSNSNQIRNLLLKIASEVMADVDDGQVHTEEVKLDIGVRWLGRRVLNKTKEILTVVRRRNWNRANLSLSSALYSGAPERIAKKFQIWTDRFKSEADSEEPTFYSAKEVHNIIIDVMNDVFMGESAAVKAFDKEELAKGSVIHPDEVSWLPPVDDSSFSPKPPATVPTPDSPAATP